jgi:predicted metal-dependent hydrolase
MSTCNRTVSYGKTKIDFELQYCDRKTLDIAVHPDQRVIVKAPSDALTEKVDQRVRDKARWILKQKDYFSQFQPRTPQRFYVSGETHLYLGRQYRLKIQPADRLSVTLQGRYIQVWISQPDNPIAVNQALETWYLIRARLKFQERLKICLQNSAFLNCPSPILRIRRLTKRWGSLTAKGNLILNRDLIRASLSGIDYVITHELCHLKVLNHSPEFYTLLASVMPDWQARKEKMERFLA